jgi:hypothetical protein
MASKYDTLKFHYSSDEGTLKLKRQRHYYFLNNGQKDYTTPLTPLFFARVVQTQAKYVGSDVFNRRLQTYVNYQGTQLTRGVAIPYNSLDSSLVAQIQEILALDNVICGDYEGESPVERTLYGPGY